MKDTAYFISNTLRKVCGGLMPCEVAQFAGYCDGVMKAIATARQAAEEARKDGQPAVMLGELIHNAQALEEFTARGVRVIGRPEEAPEGARVIDAGGRVLAPGYIDLHVHGGGGRSVMEGTDEAIVAMANAHAMYGTTSILPTTLSMPLPAMAKAGEAVGRAMADEACLSTILGVHQEGPCLSPAQGGAQSVDALLTPSQADLTALIENCPHLKMMGVAPELDGALALGRRLFERGVVASVAHSDADYDTVARASLSGFSDVTHLYSGCSSVVRKNAFRVAGVVEAGLEMERLTVQLIADGCHLPLPLLRLIYRCKGAEKMYAVTDGLEFSAARQEEGVTYVQKNGQPCVYEDGVMKLPSRTAFAGSVATMSRLVRTLVKAGIPLCDAMRMATDTPARRVGAAKKGRVAAGCDADLLLLDESLRVTFCMAKGKVVSETGEPE